MKIILKNNIDNISLQVGHTAYYVTPSVTEGVNNSLQTPLEIGPITSMDSNSITIDVVTNTPSDDDFIMFQMDRRVNNTSLLGYYAEVKLNNNSKDQAELFALSSEVAPSSK